MSTGWCCETATGIRIIVQITPNAKKNEIVGPLEDVLKIRLHAQPIEGKANDALVRYLADLLDVPKSAVTIARGHTGKRKIIELVASGLAVQRVHGALLGAAV